ncbi:NUDIX hydrolase [Halobacillus sp. A5]|uniref:NUDIX hydrolase n=1 Tax=Halobacillus sp. A5 TaxID=2880263 RepID=UPI0020A63D29|nr:NUDIX hydrolase [Halobacillus sp. A5]MCP3029474.1 NUDIX hydrolase [Halobacillus sp. A5]
MAKTTGCFTMIFNKEGQILLAKRKDYPLWDFPGGTLEDGESLERCAIREAEEETGFIVSITRKVGEYDQPQYEDKQYIFLGEIEGGSPIKDGPETERIEWFNPNRLPMMMIPNRKKQIKNHLRHQEKMIKDSITVSPLKISLLKVLIKIVG